MDSAKARESLESVNRGVIGSKTPNRLRGRTTLVVESETPDKDLYGGGRKGAKT